MTKTTQTQKTPQKQPVALASQLRRVLRSGTYYDTLAVFDNHDGTASVVCEEWVADDAAGRLKRAGFMPMKRSDPTPGGYRIFVTLEYGTVTA